MKTGRLTKHTIKSILTDNKGCVGMSKSVNTRFKIIHHNPSPYIF